MLVQLPDYHEIIENPMDFGTVRMKLDQGAYSNLEQFEVRISILFLLVWSFEFDTQTHSPELHECHHLLACFHSPLFPSQSWISKLNGMIVA